MQVPAAEPQPAAVAQHGKAQKKQSGAAAAQAPQAAAPRMGAGRQTLPQRQPGAAAATAPPGAALHPRTGRQDRQGGAPAKPQDRGRHRGGEPGAAPGMGMGGPGPGAGAPATRQAQANPCIVTHAPVSEVVCVVEHICEATAILTRSFGGLAFSAAASCRPGT